MGVSIVWGLMERPKSVDFPDIVHQCKQPPLYIYFHFVAQCKAAHTLVHADVGEDRLDNPQPPGWVRLLIHTSTKFGKWPPHPRAGGGQVEPVLGSCPTDSRCLTTAVNEHGDRADYANDEGRRTKHNDDRV